MNLETLLKYLDFLKKECLRHQNDNMITDDEINQLRIEINRFLERVLDSSFSEELKSEISKIDFDLNEENHNHSKFKIFKFIGGFQGNQFREQENRKQRFLKLYKDIDTCLFMVKSIL